MSLVVTRTGAQRKELRHAKLNKNGTAHNQFPISRRFLPSRTPCRGGYHWHPLCTGNSQSDRLSSRRQRGISAGVAATDTHLRTRLPSCNVRACIPRNGL